jgi:hypothetical protein
MGTVLDTVSTEQANCGNTDYGSSDSTMHKTVYYLTHRDSGLRLRYYTTLAGARIAQRQRNRRLGFLERVERVEVSDNCEAERCELADGTVVDATWCIVEDTVDTLDLEEQKV